MIVYTIGALTLLTFTCTTIAIAVGLWQPKSSRVSREVMDRWRNLACGLRELADENMLGLHKLQQQLRKLPAGVARQYLARIVGDMERLIDNNEQMERVLGAVHSALQEVMDGSGSNPVLVRHLMSQPVQTVAPSQLVVLAAKRLVDYRIRHLLVVGQDGCLIGVVSDRDVLKHLSPWLSKLKVAPAGTLGPTSLTVGDVMSSAKITVGDDTPLGKAAALMASKRINCLPVVGRDQQPIGILTSVDVLLHVAASAQPS